MTDVNTLNERTKQEAEQKLLRERLEYTGDKLAALLIAIYRLPLEQRTVVLEQYEHNFQEILANKQAETEEVCDVCNGDGYVDIDGDAGDHGWDKIGEKPCPKCYPPYEDPIQD